MLTTILIVLGAVLCIIAFFIAVILCIGSSQYSKMEREAERERSEKV